MLPWRGDPGLLFGLPIRIRAGRSFALDTGIAFTLSFGDPTVPGLMIPIRPRISVGKFYFGIDTGVFLDEFRRRDLFIPREVEFGFAVPTASTGSTCTFTLVFRTSWSPRTETRSSKRCSSFKSGFGSTWTPEAGAERDRGSGEPPGAVCCAACGGGVCRGRAVGGGRGSGRGVGQNGVREVGDVRGPKAEAAEVTAGEGGRGRF